jgi:hypothetical protein
MQVYFFTVSAVTRGRPKRKRKTGAGTGVTIKPHTRTPRGSNSGKPAVRVDGYKRGKPPKKKRRKRR